MDSSRRASPRTPYKPPKHVTAAVKAWRKAEEARDAAHVELQDAAAADLRAGASREQVATRLGIHPNTIGAWARDRDVPVVSNRRNRPSQYQPSAQLREAIEAANRAWEDACETIGYHPDPAQTLTSQLKELRGASRGVGSGPSAHTQAAKGKDALARQTRRDLLYARARKAIADEMRDTAQAATIVSRAIGWRYRLVADIAREYEVPTKGRPTGHAAAAAVDRYTPSQALTDAINAYEQAAAAQDEAEDAQRDEASDAIDTWADLYTKARAAIAEELRTTGVGQAVIARAIGWGLARVRSLAQEYEVPTQPHQPVLPDYTPSDALLAALTKYEATERDLQDARQARDDTLAEEAAKLEYSPARIAAPFGFSETVVKTAAEQRGTPTIGTARDAGEQIKELTAYIRDNPGADLSLPTLAERVDMSPQHFALMFKRHAKTTAGKYVRKTRMQHAARLLTTTNRPVKEIIGEIGYTTVASLAAPFRDEYGQSPEDYRATHTKARKKKGSTRDG